MANDHDEDDGEVIPFPIDLPGLKITEGTVRVYEVGGEQVDRPDIAAKGLNAMSQAIESAGGEIVGPIRFEPPNNTSSDDAILDALDFPTNPDDHLLD